MSKVASGITCALDEEVVIREQKNPIAITLLIFDFIKKYDANIAKSAAKKWSK
ncbi:hypothetical protein NSMS1_65960 (plasmid) [Nostoc sp. MS1]|nr:hypothetical protein NSMS1_65960 [Nostoc sp. MS1]